MHNPLIFSINLYGSELHRVSHTNIQNRRSAPSPVKKNGHKFRAVSPALLSPPTRLTFTRIPWVLALIFEYIYQ